MPVLLISWLVVGLIVGLWFHLFSVRRFPGGAPGCMLIGILGASAAGYLVAGQTGTDLLRGPVTVGSLMVTFVAAVVTLAMWKLATKPNVSAVKR